MDLEKNADVCKDDISSLIEFFQISTDAYFIVDESLTIIYVNHQSEKLSNASELLPDLFKPFVQADDSLARSSGGLGLGLSIAKGLIDLHGGTIQVKTEGIGKGTEFTMRLPLS